MTYKRINRHKKLYINLGILAASYIFLVELLVYFETGQPDILPTVDTFWEGLWYTTVTIAGVGYGDYVPHTINGKIVGYIFVVASIGLYGVLVSRLTSHFAQYNENKKMGFFGTEFENHTFILGWDNYAKSVADHLVAVGTKLVIVTKNKETVELIHEYFHNDKQVFVVFSEYDNYDLLRKANIEKSAVVFVNTGDDTHKLVDILNLRREFPDVKYIVTLENTDLKDTFRIAGVTYPLSKHDLSSKLLASYIFEPDVASFGEELLSYAKTDEDHDIKQYYVTPKNPYVGKQYDEVFYDMKRSLNSILIGISKENPDGLGRNLMKNPEGDVVIEPGDYLLLICNGEKEKGVSAFFGVQEGIIHQKNGILKGLGFS